MSLNESGGVRERRNRRQRLDEGDIRPFIRENPERSERRKPVTGVILAGGNSRRMGENKALMRLGDDTLIEHVIRRVRPVTDELLLITNTPDVYTALNLPMYSDIILEAGALGGIHAGLNYASHDTALCVACDTPFLAPKLLTYLISILDAYDAVVPYTEGDADDIKTPSRKFQTLCTVYSKRCIPTIGQMLEASELSVHQLYSHIRTRMVPPESWKPFDAEGFSFFNLNTPEDFENARRFKSRREKSL